MVHVFSPIGGQPFSPKLVHPFSPKVVHSFSPKLVQGDSGETPSSEAYFPLGNEDNREGTYARQVIVRWLVEIEFNMG